MQPAKIEGGPLALIAAIFHRAWLDVYGYNNHQAQTAKSFLLHPDTVEMLAGLGIDEEAYLSRVRGRLENARDHKYFKKRPRREAGRPRSPGLDWAWEQIQAGRSEIAVYHEWLERFMRCPHSRVARQHFMRSLRNRKRHEAIQGVR